MNEFSKPLFFPPPPSFSPDLPLVANSVFPNPRDRASSLPPTLVPATLPWVPVGSFSDTEALPWNSLEDNQKKKKKKKKNYFSVAVILSRETDLNEVDF
jgi:hypothetical protein